MPAPIESTIAIEGVAVRRASGFGERLRGLMWTARLPANQGLLLPRCASVHTCFMRYPIDLVYLDARGVVTKLVGGLKPWRASFGAPGSVQTLELAAGCIERLKIRIGDELRAEASAEGNAQPSAEARAGRVTRQPAPALITEPAVRPGVRPAHPAGAQP